MTVEQNNTVKKYVLNSIKYGNNYETLKQAYKDYLHDMKIYPEQIKVSDTATQNMTVVEVRLKELERFSIRIEKSIVFSYEYKTQFNPDIQAVVTIVDKIWTSKENY